MDTFSEQGHVLRQSLIRVAVVDDHPLVRESISFFLSKEKDIEVVAAWENADRCLATAPLAMPDIILMDIEMPGSSAFQVARELHRQGSSVRFIFLSAFLTDSYLQEATHLGVSGYVIKSARVEDIAHAVREVAAGRSYFAPAAAARLSELERSGKVGQVSRLGRLTARELEVLRLVASDLSCKEIAVKLGLSVRTVDRHKANIMEKLGIHSQVGLTRFAVAEGVCNPRMGT